MWFQLRLRPEDVKGKRMEAVLSVAGGDMASRMGLAKASKLRKTVPRSGEVGQLGICVPSNSVTRSFREEINSTFYGTVYLFESGSESHFMTAETTLEYLNELIAPAT